MNRYPNRIIAALCMSCAIISAFGQGIKYETVTKHPNTPEVEVSTIAPFDPENDLKVEIARQVVSASAKGRAVLELKVSNKGEVSSGPLTVTLECGGLTKESTIDLGAGATCTVSISVPAKFSVSEVSRTLKWTITADSWERDGSANVKIKRYKPQR